MSLATALVNSYGWTSGIEHLNTNEDVDHLVTQHAESWSHTLPACRASDLEAIRLLRSRLRRIFDASDASAAADEINGILTDHGATPSLSVHGQTPHLHFEPTDGTLTDWLAVVTAMGVATVIAEQGFDRLGVCQAEGCRDVYLDTSRNRSRRHCADACRNRENVAAHRRRVRGEG